MSSYQVEMWWTCDTCKHDNLGRYKQCQGCGKAKEGEIFFDKEGPELVVTDPELLKKAKGGSDFECKYCGSHNFRINDQCAECGSLQGNSRNHPTQWNDGDVGPAGSGANDQEEAQALDNSKPSLKRKPIKSRPPSKEMVQALRTTGAPENFIRRITSTRLSKAKPAGLILLTILIISVVSYLLFRTREIEAQVVAVEWTHMVHVERYQAVADAGFSSEMPTDAVDVEYMGERHHHYEKQFDRTIYEPCRVQCGENCHTTPKVCSTTPKTCTSNKNGFKSCTGGQKICSGGNRVCQPKYCSSSCKKDLYKDVSIKMAYYKWHAWRWKHDRNIIEEGYDNNPFWPSEQKINLQNKERTSRSFDYTVKFADEEGDVHLYRSTNESEFRSLTPGTRRKVLVRVLGANELVP